MQFGPVHISTNKAVPAFWVTLILDPVLWATPPGILLALADIERDSEIAKIVKRKKQKVGEHKRKAWGRSNIMNLSTLYDTKK